MSNFSIDETTIYEDLFTRIKQLNSPGIPTTGYEEPIVGIHNHLLAKLPILFMDVFGHHVDVYNMSEPILSILRNDDRRWVSSDNITAYFLEKIYQVPILYRNATSINEMRQENEIELEDFINEFSGMANTTEIGGSNRVSYFVGNIGEGKSTFITKIIRKMMKDSFHEEVKKIPIYIDIENLYYNKGKNKLEDINKNFFNYLFREILGVLTNHYKDINIEEYKGNIDEGLYALKLLIKYLQNKNVNLIFILDNIDGYHFYHSKHIFKQTLKTDNASMTQENVVANIGQILKYIQDSSYLGDRGLCVLIVCRPYVYYEHRNHQGRNLEPSKFDGAVYRMRRPSLNTVIASRTKLFNDISEVIKRDRKNLVKYLDELNASLEKNLEVEEELHALSGFEEKEFFLNTAWNDVYILGHHGFRTLVNFIANMNFDFSDEYVRNRIIENPKQLLIVLYILNMKCRYTQAEDHFPNIFLIDAQIYPNTNCLELYKPHQHTYWLKYLLLEYIRVFEITGKPSVNASQCIRVFSDKFSAIGSGYEQDLVRLTLGSLSTINEYQCIRFQQEIGTNNPLTENLILTDRGHYLLGFNKSNILDYTDNILFVFQPIYLELMIDDYLLALPTFIATKIHSNTNYEHLLKGSSEFLDSAMQNITIKAYKVIHFINLLRSSYEAEKKYRNHLYDYLLNKIDDFREPDFEKIASHTIEYYTNSSQLFSKNIDKDKLEQEWVDLRNDDSLEEWFILYYNSKIKIECLN